MGEIIIKVPQDIHKEYRLINKAVLTELLVSLETKTARLQPDRSLTDEWRQKLLAMAVWSDEDIRPIKKARRYLNRWRPRPLS